MHAVVGLIEIEGEASLGDLLGPAVESAAVRRNRVQQAFAHTAQVAARLDLLAADLDVQMTLIVARLAAARA